jgi:hypothetical protein
MIHNKSIISPIEYRIILARENIKRGKLYFVKDYTLWIIRKHSRSGKFNWPTKDEMRKYNYRMKEFLDDFID